MSLRRFYLGLSLGLLVPSLALAQSGQSTGGNSSSTGQLAAAVGDSINACYVPVSGTIYRIGLTGLPSSCLAASHIRFSRSEEHTSELQSRLHLVCRLLLEKKN